MAARTRSHPRGTQRTASSRKRRTGTGWTRTIRRHPRLAVGLLAGVLVAPIAFVVDFAAVRDGVLRTTGLGGVLLATAAALLTFALKRRAYRQKEPFVRHLVGGTALLLFLWGALGLNTAHWQIGEVDFREVSLGGDVGRTLVTGFMGKLAWLSTLVIAMAFLAPRASLWLAVNVPAALEEAWNRRLPHRAAANVQRFIAFAFRRPMTGRGTAEPIIGVGTAAAPVRSATSMEAPPLAIRPSIDPAAPLSTLGAGAAAAFTPAVAVAEPVVEQGLPAANEPPVADDESQPEPEEPHQLGLDLDERSGWQLPAIELLNEPQESKRRTHDNAARAQLIVDTLASFGVDATVVEINEGPTVTQFGVEPGWEVRHKDVPIRDENGKTVIGADGLTRTERIELGRTRVRVNRITTLQNDLALALAAPSLRIEAPVPGRAIVGIEVPNDSATVVSMRSVMETKEFRDLAVKSKLALALGRGVAGSAVVADLAKMPHLLIAGATGSGKSVCMNAIIAGIMMNATPDQVRFVMVDPKRVELTGYKGIPHMAFSEVIVDMDKVVGTLQAVVAEMESRYKKFADMGVRNIEGYNRHPRVLRRLPYWVVLIDELADLMMAAPFEVEKLICRLAQLARATGIHLVVATQRPSVDVITGLIKANFPTRVAFAVTSMTDSRTILDTGGAEKLLGRGDMLYLPTDAAKPIRIQGVYVSDAEVERLVEWWKDERFGDLVPETADGLLEQALLEQNGGEADIEVDEDDPMIPRARSLARQHNRISPSMLQRRLRVGYLKACKLMDVLEDEGVVGPREEGESRRVLATAADEPVFGGRLD